MQGNPWKTGGKRANKKWRWCITTAPETIHLASWDQQVTQVGETLKNK